MTREYITKSVSDSVKQASGFKCAWCGCFLTERHHIIQCSLGGKSSEDNLILLCPNCHNQTHKGKIQVEELLERQIELTGKVDRSSGCLSINGEKHIINIGGSHFINCPNILTLNDIPLIQAKNENGYLMLSLRLFNEDGNLICWMSDNRWWVENNQILDFKYSKNKFIINHSDRNVLKVIIRENGIDICGKLYLLGGIWDISRDDISLDDISFKNKLQSHIRLTCEGLKYGLVIKEKDFKGMFNSAAAIQIEI